MIGVEGAAVGAADREERDSVETAVGIALVVISALMIAGIVRVVSANLPR